MQGSLETDATGGGLAFAAFYARKGEVLAVCTLGKDPVAAHASQLFNANMMPSAEVLKSGKDILSVPLIST
jgi:hypothetical protein